MQADNIRQLRGLAERMDREAFLPFREEDFSPGLGRRMIHYRDILDEVWKRCTDIGWVVSSQPTSGYSGYGRHVAISGEWCWFGVFYDMWARSDTPPTPIWIQLYGCNPGTVDKVLAKLKLQAFTDNNGGINYVPLRLKTHDEYQEVVDALMLKLECLTRLIAEASQP